jgi:NAD(P)H dehydrogenase (quinone)
MNIFIVYAHPEPKSFNGAMKDIAVERLLDPDKTPRLFFHSVEDYGPNERLKPGVLARSGVQHNV